MLDSLDTLISFVLIMLLVSLLITVVVQMISTTLNLRGKNLAKALAFTLDTASPGTTQGASAPAKALADHILTLPYLSDSGFFRSRRATAVRPQEVFATLVEIARERPGTGAALAQSARQLLGQFGVPQAKLDAAAASKKTLDQVTALLRAAKDVPNAAQLADQLEASAHATAHATQVALADSAAELDDARAQFQFWFDSAQNRAQQWFASHTRCISIALALFAACWLQLDTVEIYQRVSTDRTLRDKLVAEAGNVSARAEKALADLPGVLTTASDGWRHSLADRSDPQTAAPAKEVYAQLPAGIRSALDALAPAPGDTREGYLVRLGNTLGTESPAHAALLTGSFARFLDGVAQSHLKAQAEDFGALSQAADRTGFPLFVPGDGRWKEETETDRHGKLVPIGRWPFNHHLLGMLMTAGLLALGAPFWYNALRGLTNLRSAVASDIQQETQTARVATVEARAAQAALPWGTSYSPPLTQPPGDPNAQPG